MRCSAVSTEHQKRPQRAVLLVILGGILVLIAPPLGLLLLLAALLPPYYAWRTQYFLPADRHHCLLPRLRPVSVSARGMGPPPSA